MAAPKRPHGAQDQAEPAPGDGYLLDNRADEAGGRFEALAAIFDPVTRARVAALGIGPGWRCWEVGAGGPSVPAWLAERPVRPGTCWPRTSTSSGSRRRRPRDSRCDATTSQRTILPTASSISCTHGSCSAMCPDGTLRSSAWLQSCGPAAGCSSRTSTWRCNRTRASTSRPTRTCSPTGSAAGSSSSSPRAAPISPTVAAFRDAWASSVSRTSAPTPTSRWRSPPAGLSSWRTCTRSGTCCSERQLATADEVDRHLANVRDRRGRHRHAAARLRLGAATLNAWPVARSTMG